MYYAIEGKRFLYVLYVIGLIIGAVVINLFWKWDFFKLSDILEYGKYVKEMKTGEYGMLLPYVCSVRIRQLLLFFLCLFLFSPFVVYTILDFVFSFLMGGFLAFTVMERGWKGIFVLFEYVFPHYIFYFLMLALIYIYLFRNPSDPFWGIIRKNYKYSPYGMNDQKEIRKKTVERILLSIMLLLLFAAGCYTEGKISPTVIKILY